ncbi:MAG: protein kinase [Chitinophagales bacterium]
MDDEVVVLKGENGQYSFVPGKESSVIGEGGSGIVYKGIQLIDEAGIKSRRAVAIKKLFVESTDDATNIERTKRAADIRIEHPGLLEIIDFVELENKYYVVSEYLEGQTLDKIIKSNTSSSKKIELEWTVDIVKQIIESLTVLHQHIPQIIHRDVKPENIMVDNHDKIKLLDYGIAKVADSNNKVTIEGSFMGTPAYLPLEQIRGLSNQISPATDFYSVGILLYQIITGALPYNGSYYEVIKAHEEDEIPKHPKLPESFYEVIKKASNKNPLHRYHKGEQFIKALDVALANKDKRKSEIKFPSVKMTAIIGMSALLLLLLLVFSKKTFFKNPTTSQTETIDTIIIDPTPILPIDTLSKPKGENGNTDLSNGKSDESTNADTPTEKSKKDKEFNDVKEKAKIELDKKAEAARIQKEKNEEFEKLLKLARAKKASGDYTSSLDYYTKAIEVKNNATAVEEKDELIASCTENYKKHYDIGRREMEIAVDYEKALTNLHQAIPYALSNDKIEKVENLIVETKKLHRAELIKRGDMKMEYGKYSDALNHYNTAMSYSYSKDLEQKIADCKANLAP